MKSDYEIYTDGSCFPNPGVGRFAFILVKNNKIIQEYQSKISEKITTNNRMEMMALIYALKYLKKNKFTSAKIYTDSIINVNIYQRALFNNYKKKRKLANLDLVEHIWNLANINYQVYWVKGHSNNAFNNYVDRLCNQR